MRKSAAQEWSDVRLWGGPPATKSINLTERYGGRGTFNRTPVPASPAYRQARQLWHVHLYLRKVLTR